MAALVSPKPASTGVIRRSLYNPSYVAALIVRELAYELPDTVIGPIVSFAVPVDGRSDAGAGLRANAPASMGDDEADSSSARAGQPGPF
jgi:hypothetical protein